MDKETEKAIRQALLRSAGSGNHLTDHRLRTFVGFVLDGKAEFRDFARIGGKWLEVKVRFASKAIAEGRNDLQ